MKKTRQWKGMAFHCLVFNLILLLYDILPDWY